MGAQVSAGAARDGVVRRTFRSWLGGVDHRYLVLSAVIVVALTVQTLNQQWSTDMWQHVSVVRELTSHPLHPHNPQVLGMQAFPTYSPYTVAVGLVAKVGGLNAITALSMAALANLLLFLTALHLAVTALTERPRAPFWSLLFTLLLWGVLPWRWSGYLNLNSIGFGLPYPSMFATGLALLGLAAMVRLCRRPDLHIAMGLAACVVVVALTHPITSAALMIGLVSIALSRRGIRSTRTIVVLAAVGVVAAALVLAWPYYSFTDLLHQSGVYDGDHRFLYVAVARRAFLGLGLLVLLWPAFRRDHRDPIVLMGVGAASAYALGYVTHTETLGRIFPLLMFAGHVSAARWITDTVDGGHPDVPAVRATGSRLPRRPVLITLGVALAVGALGVSPVLPRFVPRAVLPASLRHDERLASVQRRFSFLEPIAQYDVVLADDTMGRRVLPALAGKVVLPGYATPFVDDIDQRRRDVQTMLADDDPPQTRRLLARYSVDYILLTADEARERRLVHLGSIVYQGADYTLIRVAKG